MIVGAIRREIRASHATARLLIKREGATGLVWRRLSWSVAWCWFWWEHRFYGGFWRKKDRLSDTSIFSYSPPKLRRQGNACVAAIIIKQKGGGTGTGIPLESWSCEFVFLRCFSTIFYIHSKSTITDNYYEIRRYTCRPIFLTNSGRTGNK